MTSISYRHGSGTGNSRRDGGATIRDRPLVLVNSRFFSPRR
jgi:hypothetical protein